MILAIRQRRIGPLQFLPELAFLSCEVGSGDEWALDTQPAKKKKLWVG